MWRRILFALRRSRSVSCWLRGLRCSGRDGATWRVTARVVVHRWRQLDQLTNEDSISSVQGVSSAGAHPRGAWDGDKCSLQHLAAHLRASAPSRFNCSSRQRCCRNSTSSRCMPNGDDLFATKMVPPCGLRIHYLKLLSFCSIMTIGEIAR